MIAAVPAALSRDRRAVLAGLNVAFGMMARAPSYVAMLERAGLEHPADDAGWTDEPLDAVVAWGDEAALHARAQELRAAGADEIVFWPFPVGTETIGAQIPEVVLGNHANLRRRLPRIPRPQPVQAPRWA